MSPEELNKFLALGVKHGASDIHLKVGDPPAYRVNGKIHRIQADRLTPAATEQIARHFIRGDTPQSEIDELTEFDTSYSIAGVARFRVNIFRQRGSLCAILRIIPGDVPKLDQLGLPPSVKTLAAKERGMVLVTGATGSGKSTTLASMVREINETRQVHILTIEDPIEYLHRNNLASVTQREVGMDTPSFKIALRASVRQDPDVVLVGEMRDPETIDISLKAAETGHLLFSTVHTTDAAKTVARLISYFPSSEQNTVRYRVAENLAGTISQRLLPRADGRGRVLACEVMVNTVTVQGYIKDPERTGSMKDVIEKGTDGYGMQSFDQHLTQLFQSKQITFEVAAAAASNPADFERNLYVQ